MDKNTEKFLDDAQERLKLYFGTPNQPVILMRAETDLLVRLLTSYHAILSTQVAHWQRKAYKEADQFQDLAMNTNLTDIALIGSISGKLRKSEGQ